MLIVIDKCFLLNPEKNLAQIGLFIFEKNAKKQAHFNSEKWRLLKERCKRIRIFYCYTQVEVFAARDGLKDCRPLFSVINLVGFMLYANCKMQIVLY